MNKVSDKIGVSPKQIRRKLRKLYGKCNGKWIITEDIYNELINIYNKWYEDIYYIYYKSTFLKFWKVLVNLIK